MPSNKREIKIEITFITDTNQTYSHRLELNANLDDMADNFIDEVRAKYPDVSLFRKTTILQPHL